MAKATVIFTFYGRVIIIPTASTSFGFLMFVEAIQTALNYVE